MDQQPRNRRPEKPYDEFREAMAPTMGRSYQVQRQDAQYVRASGARTALQSFISTVASLLNLALAVRLVTHLFSGDVSNGWVNFIDSLTNWLVAPFQTLFTSLPLANTSYFDLPALAAIIVVTALAYILNRILRDSRRDRADDF